MPKYVSLSGRPRVRHGGTTARPRTPPRALPGPCTRPHQLLDVLGCVCGAKMPKLLSSMGRGVKQFVVYKTTCGLPVVGLSVMHSYAFCV